MGKTGRLNLNLGTRLYCICSYIYIPIGSMYGIFTYIWLKSMVHVGKYTIHGSHGCSVLYYSISTYQKSCQPLRIVDTNPCV